jgi:hypothetical protein
MDDEDAAIYAAGHADNVKDDLVEKSEIMVYVLKQVDELGLAKPLCSCC